MTLDFTFFWHCMWILESPQKVLLHTGHQWTPQAKALLWLMELSWIHCFFSMEHHFHFKECMTDKLGLFIPELLAFFTSKWMMWTWVLHGKEKTKFVTNNKVKIKILENCIHHCELDSFTIPSPDEIDDNINVCGFWNCIMKCINIWKTGITQWTSVFQITNVWC